jgi:sigma-E factor negative regulatory protein RseA
MHALAQEPIVFAPNASAQALSHSDTTRTKKLKNHPFWSIAASVAAVMFVGVMVLQLTQPEQLAPIEIAQSMPMEYLQAHQAAAPNGAAYYIHNASFTESK